MDNGEVCNVVINISDVNTEESTCEGNGRDDHRANERRDDGDIDVKHIAYLTDNCIVRGKFRSSHSYEYEGRQTGSMIMMSSIERNRMAALSRSAPSLIDSSMHHMCKKDITSTPLYKEIYANNIRRYSFLLARQLGTCNHSPQELRKIYLQNQQKADARVANGNATCSVHRKEMTSSTTSSTDSLCEISIKEDDKHWENESAHVSDAPNTQADAPLAHRQKSNSEKYRKKASLTDISDIRFPCTSKTLCETSSITTDTQTPPSTTTKIQNVSTSPTRASTAEHYCDVTNPSVVTVKFNSNPEINSNVDTDVVVCTEETITAAGTVELDQRQNEANKRHRLRLARLNSFDNMVSNANSLMKNLKSAKNMPTSIKFSIPYRGKKSGKSE